MRIKVFSLDVWGNADEGFEINDLWSAGTIECDDPYDDKAIVDALIDAGYLRDAARGRVRVEYDGNALDETRTPVEDAETGEPLYLLEGV